MDTKNKEYKSPISALLWSLALPGFGQIYNGQVILGVIFMIWELGINWSSKLNLSIMETFHGDFQKAHDVINYGWGMFYPSIYCFSMWQAYNKSITINAHLEGKQNKETKLTGLFFGITVGMNLGIYWHTPFGHIMQHIEVFGSPVFLGSIGGLIFGLLGHLIEKNLQKKSNK